MDVVVLDIIPKNTECFHFFKINLLPRLTDIENKLRINSGENEGRNGEV